MVSSDVLIETKVFPSELPQFWRINSSREKLQNSKYSGFLPDPAYL